MFSKKIVTVAILIGIIFFLWGFVGFPWGNLSTQLVTALFTVIAGVLVLVFGQIAIKFFIEPLQRQKACIEDIAYYLTFYADLWNNPGNDSPEERQEGSDKVRGLASRLVSTTNTINFFYPLLVLFKLSPSYRNIYIVKLNLIGISNSFFARNATERSHLSDRNTQRVYNIEKALGLSTGLGIDIEEIRNRITNN
ncbi:MAG: hypothetical protein ACC609_09595 [Methanobacterium formicicum]